jgi:hypothetical protein
MGWQQSDLVGNLVADYGQHAVGEVGGEELGGTFARRDRGANQLLSSFLQQAIPVRRMTI